MSQQTNASDIQPQAVYDTATLFNLPLRAEKQIAPLLVTTTEDSQTGNRAASITQEDFRRTAARSPAYEFIEVRIGGRGGSSSSTPDPGSSVVYRFLINPKQVSIERTQLDAETLTRGGWQMGVWGEDFIGIRMEGKTPGRYCAHGLTDALAEYTLSYRNLLALEVFFENNGYWYEGEQAAEGPLAAGYTRRNIKMHTDVELTVGEFIFSGMFDSLSISEDADNPHLATFSIHFVAWRERFRKGTPYPDPIGGAVNRGHVPEIGLAQALPLSTQEALPLSTDLSLSAVLRRNVPANVSLDSAALLTGYQPSLPINGLGGQTSPSLLQATFAPTVEDWNSL